MPGMTHPAYVEKAAEFGAETAGMGAEAEGMASPTGDGEER
jgi:hypothetical protein